MDILKTLSYLSKRCMGKIIVFSKFGILCNAGNQLIAESKPDEREMIVKSMNHPNNQRGLSFFYHL